MFYRIKNNEVLDYADYEYAKDCLFTDACTMAEFDANKKYYAVENNQIKLCDNAEEMKAQDRQEQFCREFFHTSLGWIRRKVTMKDGSVKDFLADLLIPIKTGIELGNIVKIITYDEPDFTKKADKEYMESLQKIKTVTMEFIQECLLQTVADFGLNEGENYGI